ncbi:nicotinate-nucleotide--dimethylbenzimidazole phosphoribosyltransferase [Chloroflexota bacterium]
MPRLSETVNKIRPLDEAAMAAAQQRQDTLTKPQGSLGRLEELSVRLAGMQRKALPDISNKAVITMAGDHGVLAERIGNWPQEVTRQMVINFISGGAGINVISRQIGAKVLVVDMGVAGNIPANKGLISKKIGRGTANMAAGPAMTLADATASVEAGIDVVYEAAKDGLDIIGTGDMGIGNTTPSAAITAVVTGQDVAVVTGRGTGLSDEQLTHKIGVIRKALEVNKPNSADALDTLAKIGGYEIGGLAGVMIGAASLNIPIVIDGFISGVAALIACGIAPSTNDYLIASHLSVESGHKYVLEHLGLKPLLDLDLRLGEGTGAAMGIFLADTACRILGEMASFAEAGVSEENAE